MVYTSRIHFQNFLLQCLENSHWPYVLIWYMYGFWKNLILSIHTMAIWPVICIPSTIRLKEENSALSKTIYVLLQIVRVTSHPVIHELNFLRLILLRHKSMHFRTTSSAIWHQTLSTQILLATFPYDFLYLNVIKF